MERQRTPEPIVPIGIQLKLADLAPAHATARTEITINEKAIKLNDNYEWLFATIYTTTNEFPHVRLFQTRTTERTLLFLRELQAKHNLDQATFLVKPAHYLTGALSQLGRRYQTVRYGNRNCV